MVFTLTDTQHQDMYVLQSHVLQTEFILVLNTNIYSFLQLLQHNFEIRAHFVKTLHTIHTTTHTHKISNVTKLYSVLNQE